MPGHADDRKDTNNLNDAKFDTEGTDPNFEKLLVVMNESGLTAFSTNDGDSIHAELRSSMDNSKATESGTNADASSHARFCEGSDASSCKGFKVIDDISICVNPLKESGTPR